MTMPTTTDSFRLSDDHSSQEFELLECPHNRVPVVAVTADAMTGTFDLCLKAGMDDYMAKVILRFSGPDILFSCLKQNLLLGAG